MTTVFIAGSISISRLHKKVQERINKIASSDFEVVVGDADGADTSIQQCLREARANHVTVYCTGDKPRNNVADWPTHRVRSDAREGSRAYFTAKDLEMARRSDYGLMIWDCKSTGTLSNVIELLKEKKKSLVFVNKMTDFVTVSDAVGLDSLLRFMSEHARKKAEEKIGLSARLAELGQERLFPRRAKDETAQIPQDDPLPLGDELCERQAKSLKLRSELMSAIKEYIGRSEQSKAQAAELFDLAEPAISDFIEGKVELFGFDELVNMALTAGLNVEMQVTTGS